MTRIRYIVNLFLYGLLVLQASANKMRNIGMDGVPIAHNAMPTSFMSRRNILSMFTGCKLSSQGFSDGVNTGMLEGNAKKGLKKASQIVDEVRRAKPEIQPNQSTESAIHPSTAENPRKRGV